MPINYKDYPEDWKDVIRPDILRRDKYRCKFCGVVNHSVGYRISDGTFIACDEHMVNWARKNGIRTFKIVLTIAHIDQNRENNNYDNLAALCQRCHNRLDAPYRALHRKQRKSGMAIRIKKNQ